MVLDALLRMRSVTRFGPGIRTGMPAVQQRLFDKASGRRCEDLLGTCTGTGGSSGRSRLTGSGWHDPGTPPDTD